MVCKGQSNGEIQLLVSTPATEAIAKIPNLKPHCSKISPIRTEHLIC